MFSRFGKKFTLPQEIIDSMPHDIFLDGELWCVSNTSHDALTHSVLLYLFCSGLGGIISKNQQRLQEGWIIRGSIGIHFVLWCLILHLPKEHILNDIPFYVRFSLFLPNKHIKILSLFFLYKVIHWAQKNTNIFHWLLIQYAPARVTSTSYFKR